MQSTRHSHALKVVSCRKSRLLLSNFPESCPPCRLHSSRSIHALSDLPPSQPNIPFIEPPAAPFFKISTRPGSARAGFFFCISSSAGIIHLFPAPVRTPSRSHFQKPGIQNALLLPLFPPFLTSQNTKKQRQALRLPLFLCRRQLIFPGRLQPSIVSTCELNFRVRYGNGWTLTVINTYYCAPAH